ncbi:NAD(P)H-hydrate epimerase [Anaerobacterium chartisolvens]|uniref:Bifunctional NAD(P)H-hydrate repair enzyme n=1 Tax=Anaerobacterium chartisolvens TaxID=1297424 RepID=A0A369ATP4_9FIRM|nr:NAD(P)H-hydrate dehydratase [Anaerobacterium chartisolvens]RCX12373.1 NAD(P)H-hydrate epimerase [Anaerobacterium chartisolvens]
MKIVTPKQMNEIDRLTISSIGIPGMVLMENAALAVVREASKLIGGLGRKKILVVAGKGNNGGDAFAAARHMYNCGASVSVYLVADSRGITGDAAANMNILRNMGVEIIELVQPSVPDALKHHLSVSSLVVDGIFGTGLKGEVAGLPRAVIELVNESRKPVISIDIPSGICGNSGRVLGTCITAAKTVTFGLPKLGLLLHPGCEHAGELVVADISIPTGVIEGLHIKTNITDMGLASSMLPQRRSDGNKGDFGRVLIISGSQGMTGAGYLAGEAALRTGAGLVYLGVPAALSSIYDVMLAEAVTIPLEDMGTGVLSPGCTGKLEELMERMSAVAIGPGLSGGAGVSAVVRHTARFARKPLIIDADAINAIASDMSILEALNTKAVLTPHPGEMSRLCGISIEEVQSDRIETARQFALKWGVTVVLKGARTVTALPGGEIYINTTGNAGMATGGSGDVLTGVIASLSGQGVPLEDAAVLGTYLHGLAGDRAARVKGQHGLIAGDLVRHLPGALKQLVKSKLDDYL